MERESLSFEGIGMKFVSAGESERNRERIHYFPPESPLNHEQFRNILKSVVYSTIPKKIFIREEDHYRIVDSKDLNDIKHYPIAQRRATFNALAAEMFWSQEVIIENAIPEEIKIANMPQAVLES